MSEDQQPKDQPKIDSPWYLWAFEWWNRHTGLGLGLMQGMTSMYFQQMRDMMDQYQNKDKK